MASETVVQRFVHQLEQGKWARWVKIVAFVAVAAALYFYFIFSDFNGHFTGLSTQAGMEQAQMARELARGHGFSTLTLKPAAMDQIRTHTGEFPDDPVPDIFHAPLPSLVLAPFLLLTKKSWDMTMNDIVYSSDRMIAGVQMLFFLGAIWINYLVLRRLFDRQLAVLVAVFMLICARFWQFSMSGLPQMLLLLLFSAAMYALVRALEALEEERSPLVWLMICAFFFGLLTLAHGMGAWIFAGCLFFVAFCFRPWWRLPLIMAAVFGAVYAPWIVRNIMVCGSPFGIAPLVAMDGLRGSTDIIMRSFGTDFRGIQPYFFRLKIINGFMAQLGNIFTYCGGVIVAPFFLVALLHLFRRRETELFKWAVLAMWSFAVLGMCVFGVDAIPLDANDLHILFIPLLTGFGLAFLQVLWSRLEIEVNLARLGFIGLLYLLSAAPMESTLWGSPRNQIQWPPYVPPFISIFREWTNPDEIIASDMPWAVGWYANRKSLWLPPKISELINLHDFNDQLHGQNIAGIYLTPITGDQPFLSRVVQGDYGDWAPLIMRTPSFRDFPFNAVTPLPLNNQCVFYSDHDRWTKRSD